jgi:rRNA maturation RNase YbeY
LDAVLENQTCKTKQSRLLGIFAKIFSMIQFNYETNFDLTDEPSYAQWIANCAKAYGFQIGELNYVFCDDAYLLKLNIEFLEHDTFTDIISFDYTMGKLLSGDIFISVERVLENAKELSISPKKEMQRVMIHGVLHYMGYKDKNQAERAIMRKEEDNCIGLFK